MKIKTQIKKGLKLLILTIFTMLAINSTISSNQKQKTEIVSFNKTLGLNANASGEAIDIKEEPEPIKPQKIERKITSLTGNLTGYSADCAACSGKLGCLPNYKVYKNNIVTFKDKTYGNVRIVASSKNLDCGSIIKINSTKVPGKYAIVLDRGVSGNNLDLLVESESIAVNKIGRSKITYEIIRKGW